jgi:hypothetical protein
MTQISARLSSENRARFEEYADKVGLDAAELARLLIVRETRARRASSLLVPNPVTSATGVESRRKLTAHFHDPKDVAKFDKHAASHGLSRAAAAKLVFERELTEMWLLRALEWSPHARSAAHPVDNGPAAEN